MIVIMLFSCILILFSLPFAGACGQVVICSQLILCGKIKVKSIFKTYQNVDFTKLVSPTPTHPNSPPKFQWKIDV